MTAHKLTVLNYILQSCELLQNYFRRSLTTDILVRYLWEHFSVTISKEINDIRQDSTSNMWTSIAYITIIAYIIMFQGLIVFLQNSIKSQNNFGQNGS